MVGAEADGEAEGMMIDNTAARMGKGRRGDLDVVVVVAVECKPKCAIGALRGG